MSIQSEIDRINQAKTDLAAAIESKGVTVPPNTTINVYPGLVQQIEQGAGLPSGGTPGQMLYQGESGAEWGDKPVMYVNVTQDSSSGSGYVADKTGSEIVQAIQDGYSVFAKFATYIIPLSTTLGQDSVMFSMLSSQGAKSISVTVIENIASLEVVDFVADSITFTPGSTGLTSTNVQDAIEEVNAKATPKSVTVTLPASGWSSNTQTVTVNGVLADESAQLIQPMPAMASQSAYYGAEVLCSGQAANSLTFTCQTVPTADLTVYVVMQEVGA